MWFQRQPVKDFAKGFCIAGVTYLAASGLLFAYIFGGSETNGGMVLLKFFQAALAMPILIVVGIVVIFLGVRAWANSEFGVFGALAGIVFFHVSLAPAADLAKHVFHA